MQESGFYSVFIESTGQVVAFHNLPLEQVDAKTQKVAFTCEGVSHIVVNDKLGKFQGKESQYRILKGKLRKKVAKKIKQEELESALASLKVQVTEAISAQFDVNYELKVTKDYMEWLKDGQPPDDEREKKFTAMQEKINAVKKEFAQKKAEFQKQLAELEKPKARKSKSAAQLGK